MYTKMRRSRQELTAGETRQILERTTSGTLALNGSEATGGFPYAVPLSFAFIPETAWEDAIGHAPWRPEGCASVGRIFFHGARAGTKLDAIAVDPRCCFTAIEQDRVVPEEYTTYFRSAMAFGYARVMDDETERRRALELLAEKYSPDLPEGREREIEQDIAHTAMIEVAVTRMSGKEAIELVRARR